MSAESELHFGRWKNAEKINLAHIGQQPWCFFWRVDIWEYTANRMYPLTFIGTGEWGGYWQPDNHFCTDFGSIPPPLNGLPSFSRTRFLKPYLFHDSAQVHGGLWYSVFPYGPKRFRKLSMLETDQLLAVMVGADEGNLWQRRTIYRSVRLASPFRRYPRGEQYRPAVGR